MKYGCILDEKDDRDLKFCSSTAKLPKEVNLRPYFTAPYNQGQLGSCTAQMAAALIQFDQNKQKLAKVMPSRLFIYFNTRLKIGLEKQDCGASIRDTIKSINVYGACHEELWGYDISKFAERPPAEAYEQGLTHQTIHYAAVSRVKEALADGYPVGVGIRIYESFESDEVKKSGIIYMPVREKSLGGHAVVVVGYTADRYIIRNSWGSDWGDRGYFTCPQEYLDEYGSDFWIVTLIED